MKRVITIIILLVIAGAAFFAYSQTEDYHIKYGELGIGPKSNIGREFVQRETQDRVSPAESGWSRYTNSEAGISFVFPSEWEVMEYEDNNYTNFFKDLFIQPTHEFAWVDAFGDGVGIHITVRGKGWGKGGTAGFYDKRKVIYVINGEKISGLEYVLRTESSETTESLEQKFDQVCNGKFSIDVDVPISAKQVTEQVLSSVNCSVN